MATTSVDTANIQIAPVMQNIATELKANGYDIAYPQGVKFFSRLSTDNNDFSVLVRERSFGLLKERSQSTVLRLLRTAGFRSADYVAKLNFVDDNNLTIETYGARNKPEIASLAEQIASKHNLNVKVVVEPVEQKEWHPMPDDF